MTDYRCYLLGEDDKIKNVEVVQCATDAAALQEAERRLATCQYPSIEVWDKARCVGIVGRSASSAGMAMEIGTAIIGPSCAQDAPGPLRHISGSRRPLS